MKQKPARLYKYEPFTTQTLKNLKNQVIYFGAPANFNDPYDCAIMPAVQVPDDEELARLSAHLDRGLAPEILATKHDISADQHRLALHAAAASLLESKLREHLRNFGVSCFSETPKNLLMWSHYAERGRGICLEFDTSFEPFELVRDVKYVDSFPQLRVSDMIGLSGESHADQILDLLFTKSRAWEYEREWRVLHKHAGTAFNYQAEALTGIYFGPETDFVTAEIVCRIMSGQANQVRYYSGSRSPSEFKVDFCPFSYTSFLEAKAMGLRRAGEVSQVWPIRN